jgi:hypothetical protein
MNSETTSPESQVMQYILGKWISKPIHTAVELGIADILIKKDRHIEELAEKTETLPDELYRMMRALSSVGIFAELENRVFVNTPLSECLTESRLKYAVLMFHSPWHDKMWNNLLYSLKTGKPAFEKVFDTPAFEWFRENPEEAEIFHKANSFKAVFSHGVIAKEYDFSRINTLTDVGGGLGNLMVEILKINTHMKGIVAELPEMVTHVDGIIKTNNLENRMSAVECNFFKKIPGGSEAYLFSHIVHDWPDKKCITILKNCRKVIPPEGRLLIAETVIPEGNTFSISKFLDLEVLLMGGGCERNKEEFKNLMKKSGFRLSQIIPTKENISIIEGVPE